MVSMVPEPAREIERLREQAGLNIEDLLAALRERREQYGPADGTPSTPRLFARNVS